MADDEYSKKLASLQQYIPFLDNIIVQLKDSRNGNRERQLAKMVSLHSMVTDKKKKLKLEVLTKCEDAIVKLYETVKSRSHSPPALSRAPPSWSTQTHSSPSPPREGPKTKPVVMPTEKIPDRYQRDVKMWQPVSSYKPNMTNLPSPKPIVFDRLDLELSKPPISRTDLEALRKDVLTKCESLNELTDLRDNLQKQLMTSDPNRILLINPTIRNTTSLTKKTVEKAALEKSKPKGIKAVKTSSPVLIEPLKVVKECSSIFGGALSSIDKEIIESREKERRNLIGSEKGSTDAEKKEWRTSEDEKKSESQRISKDERKCSDHQSKKNDERKDKSKDRKDRRYDKRDDYDKDRKKNKAKKNLRRKDGIDKPQDDKPTEQPQSVKPPLYERLVDKYNPKPRKPEVEDTHVTKKVLESIKSSSSSPIPFLELLEKSSTKPLLPLPVPLLCPTSTLDNEVACFNRKPLLPQPVPPPVSSIPIPPLLGVHPTFQTIPPHVTDILANPNTNNVSNQFKKRRQTPTRPPSSNRYVHVSTPILTNFENNNDAPNQRINNQGPGFWTNQHHPQHQGHGQPRDSHVQNFQPRSFASNENDQFDENYQDDWRRHPQRPPSTSNQPPPSQVGDIRLHRDAKLCVDSRNVASTSRRDSREYERDERKKVGDPGLNRFRSEHERENPKERESKLTSGEPTKASRRISEAFASPLDSLYGGSEGFRKTGKGYGLQKFKIPKIKKVEDAAGKDERKGIKKKLVTDEKQEIFKKAGRSKRKLKRKKRARKWEEAQNEEGIMNTKVVLEPEPDPEDGTNGKVTMETDKNVVSTSVLSSTGCDSKSSIEKQSEVGKKSAETDEISSTNDIGETQPCDQSKPLDDEGQTDSINKFLKKLFENERTRAAVSIFIDNVSNSLDDEKLKMVVQTVKSQTMDEDVEEKKPVMKKKKSVKKQLAAKLVAKKRQMRKRLMLQRRRKRPVKVIPDAGEEQEEEEEEGEEKEEEEEEVKKEEVVVSVGERIKSRVGQAAAPRMKSQKKTELDLLHDDIQNMFIRDDVLTATGKRMYRLSKTDNEVEVPVSPEPKRKTQNSSQKFDSKINVSNMRVLVPKISIVKLAEIDDESQRFQLRRANKSAKSYVEVGNEDEREMDKRKKLEREEERERKHKKKREKEEGKRRAKVKEDAEQTREQGRDKEKEKVIPPKKAKKRSNAWANGVLPKPKKKKPMDEKENPELDKSFEFVELDHSYCSSVENHVNVHHLSVTDDDALRNRGEEAEEPKPKKKKPNKKVEETGTEDVDELSNGLLQEEQHIEAPPPELVTAKNKSADDSFIPELELELSFAEPILNMSPNEPTKVTEPVAASTEVVQKDTSIIQNMIQKLHGMLKGEKNEGLTRRTPLVVQDVKAVISAGFLNIYKTVNGLEYACRVPSCLFTSTDRDSFVLHWKEDHTTLNQNHKATKCRACNKEVKTTPETTLLLTFFAHVENEHICGIRTSFNAGLISIDKVREGCEYICLVSMCNFITKNRDTFVLHLNHHKTSMETCKSTKCEICQVQISATADSDLLISLFAHIEGEHLEQEKPPQVSILHTRALSEDKLPTAKEESPELQETDDNPFPFKIAGVMSLAENPVPPLTPISDKPPPKVANFILKEAKMSGVEKTVTWKCSEAVKKFLQRPDELYKCPQFFCKFSTTCRHIFEGHVIAHARFNDELVSCVYCDVKTPLSHAGLHIDFRHSNCSYSCSQCLYRASTMEYVMIHNRMKHKDNDLVVALSPKNIKTIMLSEQKRYTVKDVCQPYRCGSQGCNAQFLFLNEFFTHLQKYHNGNMMCGHLNNQQRCPFHCDVVEKMIDHWRSHACYHYHCLLCKVGAMEMYTMLEHYALTHPNMEPMVVDRRNAPMSTYIFGYSDEAALKIRFIKQEILESVTVRHVTTTRTQEAEPPKRVTFTKVVAITPNNAVLPTSTVMATSTPIVTAAIATSSKEEERKGILTKTANESSAAPLRLESDRPEMHQSTDHHSFGLIGYQLYRCSFCDISFLNARNFKVHTMQSKECRDPVNSVKPYKCVHCHRLFKNPHGLLEHIQYHGQLRFGCALCEKKYPSSFSVKLHMRSKHNVTKTITTPLVPNKVNVQCDKFILRPVPTSVDDDGGKEGSPKIFPNSDQKRIYGPDEISQLPRRDIFNVDVKCALCWYVTKIRTNLVRHLQSHSAGIPSVDKNGKMFHNMTNRAVGSFSGSSGSRMGGPKPETKVTDEDETHVPAYVPANRRYVCCAQGCNYHCLEESNLRLHLHVLHAQQHYFTCSHCKMNLRTDVEGVLEHLKFHDLHLYKCSECSFVHNVRHKVDKHASDKHPGKVANRITIRALETELTDPKQSGTAAPPPATSNTPTAPNIKLTKPWHCGMCKYRCAAESEIIAHIFNKHDINTQFKCTLCSYNTDEKHTFEGHFKDNHPDSEIGLINVYYNREEAGLQCSTDQKQLDTTPLWQRDCPRSRYIRGIVFEKTNSSPSKMKSRSMSVTPTSSMCRSPDLAIDAVAEGVEADVVSKMMDNLDMAKPIEELNGCEDDALIIIDDDDVDDVVMDGSKLDESNDDLMIDDVADMKEVQKETGKEFLSDEILCNKYGNLCIPQANAFTCPLCDKQRWKVSSFVHHILKEMKCNRFKCKSCDYASVTLDSMVVHCQYKHESMDVTDLMIDKTLEYWLQNLISYQSKYIVQQMSPPLGESKSSGVFKIQCTHCQRWQKNARVLEQHELHHWADHTYCCDHCCSDFTTLNELFQHTFLTHANYHVSFTPSGPYVGSVIAALKPPQAKASPLPFPHIEENKFACVYCPESGRTMEALRSHVKERHEGVEFRYKVAPPAARNEVDLFSCSYCDETGSEEFVMNHHKKKHSGLQLNMHKYVGLELRGHFTGAHAGEKLSHGCAEDKPGGSQCYTCTKCLFRCGVLEDMKHHLRKHLRPIDCLTCKATFIYRMDARAHHNKQHSHIYPEKVAVNVEKIKEYEDLVAKIVAASKNKGNPALASASTPALQKMVARKSTGAPFVRK